MQDDFGFEIETTQQVIVPVRNRYGRLPTPSTELIGADAEAVALVAHRFDLLAQILELPDPREAWAQIKEKELWKYWDCEAPHQFVWLMFGLPPEQINSSNGRRVRQLVGIADTDVWPGTKKIWGGRGRKQLVPGESGNTAPRTGLAPIAKNQEHVFPEPTEDPIYDELGMQVPEELRPVFFARQTALAICAEAQVLGTKIIQCCVGPGGHELKAATGLFHENTLRNGTKTLICDSTSEIIKEIKSRAPYALCPKCYETKPEPCGYCSDRRWVSEFLWHRLKKQSPAVIERYCELVKLEAGKGAA